MERATMVPERDLTFKEVLELLQVSRMTLLRIMKTEAGIPGAYKAGHQWRFTQAGLRLFRGGERFREIERLGSAVGEGEMPIEEAGARYRAHVLNQ